MIGVGGGEYELRMVCQMHSDQVLGPGEDMHNFERSFQATNLVGRHGATSLSKCQLISF